MVGFGRRYTYVAFDGDSDLMSYRTLQAWSTNPAQPFYLYDAHGLNYARDDSLTDSIIAQLKPRLDVSRHVLLLVSEATARNRRGILQYELRYAIRYQLPILAVFIGFDGSTSKSDALWYQSLYPRLPAVLREETGPKHCVILPFTMAHVRGALASYDALHLPPDSNYTWYW